MPDRSSETRGQVETARLGGRKNPLAPEVQDLLRDWENEHLLRAAQVLGAGSQPSLVHYYDNFGGTLAGQWGIDIGGASSIVPVNGQLVGAAAPSGGVYQTEAVSGGAPAQARLYYGDDSGADWGQTLVRGTTGFYLAVRWRITTAESVNASPFYGLATTFAGPGTWSFSVGSLPAFAPGISIVFSDDFNFVFADLGVPFDNLVHEDELWTKDGENFIFQRDGIASPPINISPVLPFNAGLTLALGTIAQAGETSGVRWDEILLAGFLDPTF